MTSAQRHLHPVPGPVRDPMGLPPAQALDSERLVLGAALYDLTGFDRVVDLCAPHDFFGEDHCAIAVALWSLAKDGKPVGLVEVSHYLREHGRLEAAGGSSYLAFLCNEVHVVHNLEWHARLIRDKARIRLLAAEARRISAECYAAIDNPQDFLDGAEHTISQIACPPEQSSVITIKETLLTVFQEIVTASESGRAMTGTATGIEQLDAKLCGLQASEQIVLAARPGMGKTAAAMAIAVNVAAAAPHPGDLPNAVLFFSLEMDRKQIVRRTACTEARVDMNRMRRNSLQPDDWDRLTQAATFLSSIPLMIDDTPAIGPLELRAKARRVKAELARAGKSRLGLVVVDYMQLMSAKHLLSKNSNREQEVSLCSQMLKDLSKELAIPVLALAQLKRDVEKQKEKRPVLSDLRESGALEQNADTVIFLHREEYYLKEKTPSAERNVAEFIVQKQRNGPLGTARTWFWGSYVLFTDEAPLGRAPLPVEDAP